MLAAHTRHIHLSQRPSSRTPRPSAHKHRSALAAASTAPGIEVELASGFKASFPATGSGLLWARSTGLKVWDGAKVLSQLLLLPTFPHHVSELHPTYYAHLSSDSSSNSSRKLSGLEGFTVVELGAGLGLCSVAAAHRGAQVTATDGDPDLVRLLKKNLAFNNGEAQAASARQLRLERQSLLSEQRHSNRGASKARDDIDVRGASYSGQASSNSEGEGSSTSGRSSECESRGLSSSQQHTRFLYTPSAYLLPWGHEHAAHELKQSLLAQRNGTCHESLSVRHHRHHQQQQQQDTHQGQHQSSSSGAPDLILMAEVVYGSDPGVWDALIKTLKALSSPGTLILQADSRRIEGVLYGEYWAALEREGFHVIELPLSQLLGPDLGLGLHPHELAGGSDECASGSDRNTGVTEEHGIGAQAGTVRDSEIQGAGMQRSAREQVLQESAKRSDSGAGCSDGHSSAAEWGLSEALSRQGMQTGLSPEAGSIGGAGAVQQALPTSRHPHVRAWAIHKPAE